MILLIGDLVSYVSFMLLGEIWLLRLVRDFWVSLVGGLVRLKWVAWPFRLVHLWRVTRVVRLTHNYHGKGLSVRFVLSGRQSRDRSTRYEYPVLLM